MSNSRRFFALNTPHIFRSDTEDIRGANLSSSLSRELFCSCRAALLMNINSSISSPEFKLFLLEALK
ncbi:hypothetical protein HMPREF0322_03621 [Desulfitobacterium hafniense DP7]|uniref:Uncharacterized protein n=1 Tax=Desulfitobacterium hafniense DP7 TaxID=537010 RepID=G9XRM3_DESHA|nr:hypothetical protein HMPREF0322_03621 [Desulfitobacterium hafniense DP7]